MGWGIKATAKQVLILGFLLLLFFFIIFFFKAFHASFDTVSSCFYVLQVFDAYPLQCALTVMLHDFHSMFLI